jgi:hypothetical protein
MMKTSSDLKPLTLDDVFDYLQDGIRSFVDHPPQGDWEKAYMRALLDLRQDLFGMLPGDRLH